MALSYNKKGVNLYKKGLPSPKKIATRGLYELMWGTKPRDYGKRLK
jgi:hypothetical protein